MRLPLLVLVCMAGLVAAAKQPGADSTVVVVDATEAVSSEMTLDVTHRKQQATTTRRLYSGDDDDDDEFCCKERATSCEPLTEGKARAYEYNGGKYDGSTVCRSYCAVPCDGDDDDDNDNDDDDDGSFPNFHPYQCFPTTTNANGCDCDCTCCTSPPPPMPMPYRGKGGYHHRRQLYGKGHHVPGRPPVTCKCSCDHCGKKYSRGDNYY